MIRIKYNNLDNKYLVSKKNFSTRVHKELVYVAIDLESFVCSLVTESIPRNVDGIVSFEPTDITFGTSLSDAKKRVKKLLVDCGVTFDVEVRNRSDV